MKNENTPAEGKDSAQTEIESALRGAACSASEFTCASCREEFVGDPIAVNGCKLCSDCRNVPLYTVEEIAQYIGGWTLGSFDEVRKLGQRVAHNALNQLSDDQDGIEAVRQRNYWQNA